MLWRPELAFARTLSASLQREVQAVQDWLRGEQGAVQQIALRERSVEIFGDEKRLDSLLGTQLFGEGRLTLTLLRCYLPTLPIHVLRLREDGTRHPALIVENHTTFDTLARWNVTSHRYGAVGYGAGTAFVSSCASLRNELNCPSWSGKLEYFGDLDPTGLWIPGKAAETHGLPIEAAEWLYELLLNKAESSTRLPRGTISWQKTLLAWLNETLRGRAEEHFSAGRRLPQELVNRTDLPLACGV